MKGIAFCHKDKVILTGVSLAIYLVSVLAGCGRNPTPTKPTRTLIPLSPASISLSGEWRLNVDWNGYGEKDGWAKPDTDDSGWEVVNVPHTWNTMRKYYDYEGLAWYRRRFTVPAGAKDAHLRLRFEAVFYIAKVWLNGEYLGQHEGGYTPFEFDISNIAKPGEENLIAVRVDNRRSADRIPASFPSGWSYDWWNYGGIVRDVWLEVSSRAFISGQQIISTPHLIGVDQADRATIAGTVTIQNLSGDRLVGMLTADVLDDTDNRSVLSGLPKLSVNLPPGEEGDFQIVTEVSSPKLWHFDHPNLYRWTASLRMPDGQILHSDSKTIGIRLIELKENRFYLNGEPVRLVGLTRHADSPQYGLAETGTMMSADYDDLKTLNEVFTRPVHYPQSDYILDYADRHGILFIPEVPAWGLVEGQLANKHMREVEKQQLREMVMTDFNHPCVWAWSIGNEFDSRTAAGHEFVKEMIALVKSLDPTRPVGFASNRIGWDPAEDATALSDFVLMNQYFGTWAAPKDQLSSVLDAIHAAWPDKTIIISEFGFEPHWNKGGAASASLDPDQYYFIPETTPSDSEEADSQRRQLIQEQMAIFRSKPFVAGVVFWTYQDYRTPTDFMMGVVDAQRKRRASWEVLRNEYAPVYFDQVTFSPVKAGKRYVRISLRTRGPIEVDMPAYTLRGYTLHWALVSSDGKQTLSQGDIALPILSPGSAWMGKVEWEVPETGYRLSLRIVRPTGFTVIEGTWASQ
jgi:beta-glucuronidase